jgi:anti-sigma B factor antagonist
MFRLARHTRPAVSPTVQAPPPATTGPARFRVTEDAASRHLRLDLRGELDLAAVPVLREHVRAAAARRGHVVIDLSGVEFIDVAGLCALTALTKEAREQGWWLDLRQPSLSVRRLVRLTCAQELFA